MKPKLYIFRAPENYWKLCLESTGGRNVAILDSDFRLNGKRQLIGLRIRSGFVEKKGASTVGGTGYIGYVKFFSFDEAKQFLEQYYDVRM